MQNRYQQVPRFNYNETDNNISEPIKNRNTAFTFARQSADEKTNHQNNIISYTTYPTHTNNAQAPINQQQTAHTVILCLCRTLTAAPTTRGIIETIQMIISQLDQGWRQKTCQSNLDSEYKIFPMPDRKISNLDVSAKDPKQLYMNLIKILNPAVERRACFGLH